LWFLRPISIDSCSPNVYKIQIAASLSSQLRAARSIKKGEELFIQYCGLDQKTAQRQLELAPYGFKCTCKGCTSLISDRVRRQIDDSLNGLAARKANWEKNRSISSDYLIKPSLDVLSMMDAEGLEVWSIYRLHLQAVVDGYTAQGDVDNVIKYGTMLGRWVLMSTGKDALLEALQTADFHKARSHWGTRQSSSST
jgi:hypothetical protein